MRRKGPVALRRDGDRTTVLLGDDERSMLIDLAEQFRSVLAADADPDLRRLYPTAYADDAERDTEYAELVHDDLLQTRLDAIERLVESATESSIDDEQLAATAGLPLPPLSRAPSWATQPPATPPPEAPPPPLTPLIPCMSHRFCAGKPPW